MPRKPSKTIQQQIYEAKLKVAELYEAYVTQLYFETMPGYDPVYKYSYDLSNFTIPGELQSVDAWTRAVIKHLATRAWGHGGAITKAVVITIPSNLGEKGMDMWID